MLPNAMKLDRNPRDECSSIQPVRSLISERHFPPVQPFWGFEVRPTSKQLPDFDMYGGHSGSRVTLQIPSGSNFAYFGRRGTGPTRSATRA